LGVSNFVWARIASDFFVLFGFLQHHMLRPVLTHYIDQRPRAFRSYLIKDGFSAAF
jgi:hypothetical protein